MKKKDSIFKDLLLIRSFLFIFQQEQYIVKPFIKRCFQNPFPRNVEKLKKLDWTLKAKLIILNAVLIFLAVEILIILTQIYVLLLIPLLLFLLTPWVFLVLGFYFNRPREIYNKARVLTLCSGKLNRMKHHGLKVIGITGSYGKTSTKVLINDLLSIKYKSYATPKSHNTLFGIAQVKFVIGLVSSVMNYLKKDTEYFLAEMGAYKIGEIEELTRAYPPDIGVLTGLTTMHFERFGSLENTIQAKSELILGLPNGGTLYINTSNEILYKIWREQLKLGRLKVYSYGFNQDADFRVETKTVTAKGTEFSVYYKDASYDFYTKIIGLGNINNIAGAIAVALNEGVTIEEIQKKIPEIEQIEARMQVIDNGTGVLLINNGFSSNPESFKQSMETLKVFDSQYKIFVTPGIFELGDITENTHRALAHLMPSEIDLVLLLGKDRNNPRLTGLYEGLKDIGYEMDKVDYIDDIKDFYGKITQRGLIPSVVLMENDVNDLENM